MWSFNRIRDNANIKTEDILWKGPFSLPGFEKDNGLKSTPDAEGAYIFCFDYQDGLVLYMAGITKSTKKRMAAHVREYRKGNYTVLDIEAANKGERLEIWPGWQYAKENRNEFNEKKEAILEAVEKQLKSYRIFITEVPDKRIRERIEAAIMRNIYASQEPWSELADSGMFLKERYNSEMPIEAKNIAINKITGLPEILEI